MGLHVIGGQGASVEFAAANSNSSSPLNTYTAAGQSLGTEHATRRMLLMCYEVNANLSDVGNIDTVTVAGVSATKIYEPAVNQIANFTIWLTARTADGGPSGTSGNVVIHRGTGNGFSTILFGMYAAFRMREATYYDLQDAALADPNSVTIDKPALGFFVGLARATTAGTYTWTNAVEQYDQAAGVGGAVRTSGALITTRPALSGVTVTADTNVGCAMIGASFR